MHRVCPFRHCVLRRHKSARQASSTRQVQAQLADIPDIRTVNFYKFRSLLVFEAKRAGFWG